MAQADADALHGERVDNVVKRFHAGHKIGAHDLFISERVVKTLPQNKLLVTGYQKERTLGLLPFTPVLYTYLCPHCIRKEDLDWFEKLVKAGLVVPILRSSYCYYPEHVTRFLLGHDHISVYEYEAHRHIWAGKGGTPPLCGHCLQEQANEVCASIRRRSNAKTYEQELSQFLSNLDPFPRSDADLIALGFYLLEHRKLQHLRLLTKASETLYEIRSGQAFGSSIILNDSELAAFPKGLTPELDSARSFSSDLRIQVAEGLKIQIPTDISPDAYIELVQDYQPQIAQIVNASVIGNSGDPSAIHASKALMEINREIERVRTLRRHAVLEACVGFCGNNSGVVAATLIAGTLGLTGSLLGCVATGGLAVATKVAKKKGWIRSNGATERLKRIVARDIQPFTNMMLKSYLRTTGPAISVLSLRKRFTLTRESEKRRAA